jgi:hypothetical protein
MLPQSYPNYKTVHRRFQAWCCNEVLRRVLTDVPNDLRDKGALDEEECFIDATFVMAKGGGSEQRSQNGPKNRHPKQLTRKPSKFGGVFNFQRIARFCLEGRANEAHSGCGVFSIRSPWAGEANGAAGDAACARAGASSSATPFAAPSCARTTSRLNVPRHEVRLAWLSASPPVALLELVLRIRISHDPFLAFPARASPTAAIIAAGESYLAAARVVAVHLHRHRR